MSLKVGQVSIEVTAVYVCVEYQKFTFNIMGKSSFLTVKIRNHGALKVKAYFIPYLLIATQRQKTNNGSPSPSRTKKQTTAVEETFNRKIGRIEFSDSKVIGRGLSTVFPGIFTTLDGNPISCAVKRVLKEKGEPKGEKKILEEIEIWQQFCNDPGMLDEDEDELPIVRCYGYEQDHDFWFD